VTLVFLVGGARSGKSSLAVELAAESGEDVTFLATGEAGDEEMRERIRRHREERPAGWTTIEEPLALREALLRVDDESTVVVDCLSLWAANVLERGVGEDELLEEARAAAAAAAARAGLTVVVSNEVGLGVVPPTPVGRRYRDVLGRVNVAWAAAADRAAFVIAGRLLPLEPGEGLLG
jgi:adenosylcobinamide kinase/adenosylcobinamide-phosphate guanylyltransferase